MTLDKKISLLKQVYIEILQYFIMEHDSMEEFPEWISRGIADNDPRGPSVVVLGIFRSNSIIKLFTEEDHCRRGTIHIPQFISPRKYEILDSILDEMNGSSFVIDQDIRKWYDQEVVPVLKATLEAKML